MYKINEKIINSNDVESFRAICYYNEIIMIIYIINNQSVLNSNASYIIQGLPKGYQNAYGVISGNNGSTRPISYSSEKGTIEISASGGDLYPTMFGLLVCIK